MTQEKPEKFYSIVCEIFSDGNVNVRQSSEGIESVDQLLACLDRIEYVAGMLRMQLLVDMQPLEPVEKEPPNLSM